MVIVTEEQQKLFPVMEVEFALEYFKISLADENAHLEVKIPRDMVNAWFHKWEAFQDEVPSKPLFIGRWYTGAWDKDNGY